MMVWQNKAKKAKMESDALDQSVLEDPDALVTCEKQRNGDWEGRLKFWFHGPSLRFCDDRISMVEAYHLPDIPARAPARFGGEA